MSLDQFVDSPWAKPHAAYENAFFNIRPAPEFATAEVVVASTYRSVGFKGYAERGVPAAGRKLDKASAKKGRGRRAAQFSPDLWRTILHGALESPKQPNQSSRRFLQLCPMVPDIALYSGSARLSGNSWDPGALVERIILFGCDTYAGAEGLWDELYRGLSVDDNDDVWARWLQAEFERRGDAGVTWGAAKLATALTIPDDEKLGLRMPARQFVRDLSAVLRAKPCMTRRQWVSLLEAVLRLGVVSHVLWLCDVNDRIWKEVVRVLGGDAPLSPDVAKREVVTSRDHYLVYGAPALPIVRQSAAGYLAARLGINLVLWHLEAEGHPIRSLSSIADLALFLKAVAGARPQLLGKDVLAQLGSLQDSQSRTIACKKGIGSNLVEFCRHTLGQRQTADQNLRGYDQGYQLKKRAEYATAPWIVSLGPVALLAFVHCCLEEVDGPRSVQRLCEHLAWYGLDIKRDDIGKSDLGRKLRMLGLVLDSPDAESGMLLIPPFERLASPVAGSGK